MKEFDSFLKKEEIKKKAIAFIRNVTLSSRLDRVPERKVLNLLKETVTDNSYKLFRGLSIPELEETERLKFSELSVGDDVPKQLLKIQDVQTVLHATKSKDVAKLYSSGGEFSIYFQFEFDKSDVICDVTNLSLIFDENDVPEKDWNYYKGAEEVLVNKNATPKNAKIVGVKLV